MNFKIVKKNFDKGLWTESLVRLAVQKGVITQEECGMILEGVNKEEAVKSAVNEAISILNGEV